MERQRWSASDGALAGPTRKSTPLQSPPPEAPSPLVSPTEVCALKCHMCFPSLAPPPSLETPPPPQPQPQPQPRPHPNIKTLLIPLMPLKPSRLLTRPSVRPAAVFTLWVVFFFIHLFIYLPVLACLALFFHHDVVTRGRSVKTVTELNVKKQLV